MPRKRQTQRTQQVTFRVPRDLYDRLGKIADSVYQPMPVIFRAAFAEYVKNHRPVRHTNHGISIVWPIPKSSDEEVNHVTEDDTPLSPESATTSPRNDAGVSGPPNKGGLDTPD